MKSNWQGCLKQQFRNLMFRATFACLYLVSSLGSGAQEDSAFLHTDDDIALQRLDALSYLDSLPALAKSRFWPNVDPELFLDNLRSFTRYPLQFYEGKGTNFCAYSSITYLPLHHDPLGFARFMVELYNEGEAIMGRARIKPGRRVRREAGLIKYKGALDINHAGQVWFLSLADHFKGYINFFNRRFDKGDENTLWASTNFAKFNRMVRRLFPYKVKARGSDLIRPWIRDIYGYIRKQASEAPVFLYLNNRLLIRKKHDATQFAIPTHFVLLLDIYKTPEGMINIVYWDYGRKTLQQVTPRLLRKIIFGITVYYPNEKNY
jgi:hypothetical protein